MSLPSSICRPMHGGNRFLRGDYRDGDTRRRLDGDRRPVQRRRAKSHSKVEKELLDRAKEKGVDRATARQTLKDKLAWREGNNTEQVTQKRWLLIVISDEYIDDMEAGKETRHRVPNEAGIFQLFIVCYAIDNTKIIEEKRFADKEPKFG
ncbi:hypothetical protein WR25_14867 [Diploscapter pachys]|uniref:Uncharacterized protein n=1 Tax=Diploscapter pachys TaxID=2018661 RepID=A0A2A2KNH0_9BILA|nr:hypothetical protein WR25_14867 [Diploscapter pachys]